MYEICSKLTIKTPEYHSGVFIVNFEQILNIDLVIRLLTLKKLMPDEDRVSLKQHLFFTFLGSSF